MASSTTEITADRDALLKEVGRLNKKYKQTKKEVFKEDEIAK